MTIEPDYVQPAEALAPKRNLIWPFAAGFGCVAGCGLLVVLSAVACGVFFWQASSNPDSIAVSVDALTVVNRGENFVITLEIDNAAAYSRELHSLDIELVYLDGVSIESALPGYVQTNRNTFFEGYAYQSYYFYQPIQASSTLVIELQALALEAGDFAGFLNVCIDTVDDCSVTTLRTLVK